MHAAAFGSPVALKLLLDKGAAVNAKNNFDATSLLWAACDAVKTRMLVERNAGVNAQSKQGRTPLMIAARVDGNSATVGLLLSKGADPRVSDSLGVTALHQAASAGDVESVRLLLAKGADVNALDKRGDSALMGAAAIGSVEWVRLLLSKGARVNVARTSYTTAKHGQIALVKVTALILAAPYGSPELIQELVDAGADVNARDSRDMTPLMFAVGSEHQNAGVVRVLLRAGAAVNAKSNLGETPLDWASKFGNPTVVSLLKGAGALRGNERTGRPHTDLESPRETRQAISQSVALIQRSSTEFFRQSGCVACYHQPAAAMALRAARKAELKVDESAAREMGEVLPLAGECRQTTCSREFIEAADPTGSSISCWPCRLPATGRMPRPMRPSRTLSRFSTPTDTGLKNPRHGRRLRTARSAVLLMQSGRCRYSVGRAVERNSTSASAAPAHS